MGPALAADDRRWWVDLLQVVDEARLSDCPFRIGCQQAPPLPSMRCTASSIRALRSCCRAWPAPMAPHLPA